MKTYATPLIVAGDVIVDWFEMATPPVDRDQQLPIAPPNWQGYAGTRGLARPGGAMLLAHLVRVATGADVRAPAVAPLESIPPDRVIHSMAALDRFSYSTGKEDAKRLVYRVRQYKGFAGPAQGSPPPIAIENDDPQAAIVVLDDAGNGFRHAPDCWPAALHQGKPTVVLKMSRPLAEGPLWEKVFKDHADRLLVVVGADDLRRSGVRISQRLSWERTAKEFVWQMSCNPNMAALSRCPRLVVRFGLDGAILYTRDETGTRARLFYDPKVGEDGFQETCRGRMPGENCAFVAAITAEILRQQWGGLQEGVRRGLQSARRLCRLGFGPDLEELAFPGEEVFDVANHEPPIVDVAIPSPPPSGTGNADPDYWCILHELDNVGLENIAVNYVIHGTDLILNRVPIGQFGKFRTVDRSEIESYRSIQNLIEQYVKAEEAAHPLNIAVFGAPGSGKSFGVAQVAQSTAPGEVVKLDFNVSQFTSSDDLIAAFHRIRDTALEGKIPIAFFDEFDADFHVELGWLKYFLMPMQDGKFRQGDAIHPLGRAIFVFAGGTCSTFADFRRESSGARDDAADDVQTVTREEAAAARRRFKDAKGPDFVSRLRGFVNIKGPNPVTGDDRLYVIRRAIYLRALLEEKTGRRLMDGKGKLRIDPGIVRAFLLVPGYKSGTRSLSAILDTCLLAEQPSFEQAALPLPEQLELHVDAEQFYRLVMRDVLLGSARETIAKAVHEQYRADQKDRKPATDPAMRPWEELAENLREANRQQADHIPIKLAAVGCTFVPAVEPFPGLFAFTAEELERMAELEHDRWNRQKLGEGWRLGPRDHDAKTTPYLVPWDQLPDDIREFDREAVRVIPALLARAGFGIRRIKTD